MLLWSTCESFGAIVLQPKKKEQAPSRGETTQKSVQHFMHTHKAS